MKPREKCDELKLTRRDDDALEIVCHTRHDTKSRQSRIRPPTILPAAKRKGPPSDCGTARQRRVRLLVCRQDTQQHTQTHAPIKLHITRKRASIIPLVLACYAPHRHQRHSKSLLWCVARVASQRSRQRSSWLLLCCVFLCCGPVCVRSSHAPRSESQARSHERE